ncbi:MAG TPA: hypothetical protein VJ306_12355, partial [Pyrinomonadaceae bacterium]|nr:hypothetical protein [Pyrinomonadaceae bacterium]
MKRNYPFASVPVKQGLIGSLAYQLQVLQASRNEYFLCIDGDALQDITGIAAIIAPGVRFCDLLIRFV